MSALHLRPPGAPAGATSWPDDFTDEERAFLAAAGQQQRQTLAYAFIQGTQPQTLGYAMLDTPVGQAAWILEKFHSWTTLPEGAEIDDDVDLDRLLTQVMIPCRPHRAHPPSACTTSRSARPRPAAATSPRSRNRSCGTPTSSPSSPSSLADCELVPPPADRCGRSAAGDPFRERG